MAALPRRLDGQATGVRQALDWCFTSWAHRATTHAPCMQGFSCRQHPIHTMVLDDGKAPIDAFRRDSAKARKPSLYEINQSKRYKFNPNCWYGISDFSTIAITSFHGEPMLWFPREGRFRWFYSKPEATAGEVPWCGGTLRKARN